MSHPHDSALPIDQPPAPSAAAPVSPAEQQQAAAQPPVKQHEVAYEQALRGRPGWWRGAVAIVSLIAAYFVISAVLGGIGFAIELATGRIEMDQLISGKFPVTPLIMLANNLSLAAMWPAAALLQWAIFGVRPRWMSSVLGRFRWRWLGRLALVIVPAWAVYVGASLLLSPLDPIRMSGNVLAMLAIVLFTTPLQSAGEEFGARGLIQRSVGSWFAKPIVAFCVATVVSASFFTLAHGAADPWLILYYFVFGASMSLTVRNTGGLEASILIHATNNVLLLIPTALMEQTDQVFERGAGTGSAWMVIPMAMCIGSALFSTWWARRNGVANRAPLPPSRFTNRPSAPTAPPAPTAPHQQTEPLQPAHPQPPQQPHPPQPTLPS